MRSDCKKPGVAFWATVVVVVLLVAYPLSFGPVCWAVSGSDNSEHFGQRLSVLYRPILWLWWNGPEPIADRIDDFANLGAHHRVGLYWRNLQLVFFKSGQSSR
jgi:hypothetical protein